MLTSKRASCSPRETQPMHKRPSLFVVRVVENGKRKRSPLKGHHHHHHYNDLLSKLKRGKRIDNNLKVKTRLGRQKTKWEILDSLWNYFDSKLKNVKTDFSGRCWRAPPELLIVTSLQSPQNLVSSWQLVVIGIILVRAATSSWGNINHKITFSFANFPLNTRRTLLEEVAEERKKRMMIISDLKYQLIH